MKFKKFLNECEMLDKINSILDEMDEDDIDEFGTYLSTEFFDEDEDPITNNTEYYYFEKSDIQEMLDELGEEFYEDILDMLEEIDDDEYETDTEDSSKIAYMQKNEINADNLDEAISKIQNIDKLSKEELDEAISKIMKTKAFNKKPRKFMKTSKADLRKTKAKRKRDLRKSLAKRKRYYRANKQKIKAYQKSRGVAISKGKHKVKKRRQAG